MKPISSDDLQLSSQLSISPTNRIVGEYQQAICDFDLSQKYQRQSSSQKKRIILSVVFIALLFLICYLTFKISIDMPNYLLKYEAAEENSQFKKGNRQIEGNPQNRVKQKIIVLANAAKKLQKKFVFKGTSDKLGSVSISKSLQQVKNIKDSIQRIQSKVNIEEKITKNQQVLAKNHVFNIPKIIWVYEQQHKSYINKLCRDNVKFYGEASGFQVRSINQTNYNKYFSIKTNLHLGKALDHVNKIRETNPSAEKLKKLVILYHALYEYGGIMVEGPFAFTQNLQWVSKISNNILKLRGDQGIVSQIIAFYKPNNSPPKKSFNIEPFVGMEQVDKFVTQIPAIQQFFMASIEKPQFLENFINKLYDILNNIDYILKEKLQYGLNYDKNEELAKQIIYTASQIVLKQKQKEIDELVLDGYKRFAFDYYGMAFINANYGPYKLDMIYGNFWLPKVPEVSYHSSYFDLARYKYQDFLAYTGPIKYLCRLNNLDRMQVYLKNSENGKDIQIFEGSLIQKLFFPKFTNLKFIVKNPQKSFTNLTNDSWDTLPKIIWIYWADGIENSSPFHQMCYENIKRTANLTGFQVIQINNDNLNRYVPQKQIQRMQATFQNAKTLLRIQSISDVYRLAVLYLHGGIYFDITSVGVQSFDWITNIGRFPSQLIFNRFGTNPKVLMTWHPYDAQPGGWQYKSINKKQSIKAQWHLALQNSFIVAQKSSQFIKEWMELMMEFIESPYDKIQSAFIESGVNQMRWTLSDNHYLLAMDTAKCVLGRRQKKIEKQINSKWINAADYYKLWSFSAYLAPTKMRSNINYDDPGQKINAYIFRYPVEYMHEVIGQTRFYIKFFGYEVTQIKKFINQHPTGNFTNDTHSRSFFRKYMWDDKFAPMIADDIKKNKQIK